MQSSPNAVTTGTSLDNPRHTSHHSQLHAQIKLLEAGNVNTAGGRAQCMRELREIFQQRYEHWMKVYPAFESYVNEASKQW